MSQDRDQGRFDDVAVVGRDGIGEPPRLQPSDLPALDADASLEDVMLSVLSTRAGRNLRFREQALDKLSVADKRLLIADLHEVIGIEPLDGIVP